MITINITEPDSLHPNEVEALILFFGKFLPEGMSAKLVSDKKKDWAINFADTPDIGTDLPIVKEALAAATVAFDTPPPASEVFAKKADAVNSLASAAPPVATPTISSIPPVPSVPKSVSLPPLPVAPNVAQNVDAPVATDSEGLPWDERIHARTKALKADGTWRQKRDMDAVTLSQVTAELREKMGLPAVEVVNPMAAFKTAAELGLVPAVPAVPPPLPPATPVPVLNSISASEIPPIPAPLPPIVTPPPPPPVATLTLPLLIPLITTALSDGTLTEVRLNEVLNANGVATLPGMFQRPDLVPVIASQLGFSA